MKQRTLVYAQKPADFSPKVEVAAVYIDVNGKLLLLESSPGKLEPRTWGVPAGKLEGNETPVAGAKRELFEETGIDIASEASLQPVGVLYVRNPRLDYVYHLFDIKLDNAPHVKLSDEHQSYAWVTLQEAEKLNLMGGAKDALHYYLKMTSKKTRSGANVNAFRFSFRLVDASHRSLLHTWLAQPYIAEWFYGDGLANTFKLLDEFLKGSSEAQFWLALDQETPVAFFITSSVDKPTDELTKWCVQDGPAITLDMSIGNASYLGKGLSHILIQEFLASEFPHVVEVLIDPEATNSRAVHIYQKAGFTIVDEYIPSHSPNPHYMMRLNLQKLR